MSHIPISLDVRFVALPVRWRFRNGELLWEKTGKEGRPVARPREVFDCFQKMEHSESASVEFLNSVGAWQVTEMPSVRSEHRGDFIECFAGHRYIFGVVKQITLDELWEEQAYWRDLIHPKNEAKRRAEFAPPSKHTPELSALQSRYFNTLPLHLEWLDRPQGVIQAVTGRELIQGLIWADIISGAKFQVCQNPDCPRKTFTWGRVRTYCPDGKCAHLMASRAYQNREREKKKKRKALQKKTARTRVIPHDRLIPQSTRV
jgi:hypothetical protein